MYELVGYVGAVLYLIGYFLLSTKKIYGNSKAFHTLNLLGAIGVSVAAIHNNDNPSAFLNIVWGSIAFITLIFLIFFKK